MDNIKEEYQDYIENDYKEKYKDTRKMLNVYKFFTILETIIIVAITYNYIT